MLKFGGLLTNEWLKMSKKKSFFIYFGILALYVAIVTYVTHNTSLLDDGSALDFVSFFVSMSTVGILLPILAIIAVSGIFPQEYRFGTIKLLLIRSQSRNKILASKYIIAVLFSLSLIAVTTVLALLCGAIVLGFDGGTSTWSDIAQNIMYLTIYTLIFVTITFMISVLTKSSGATIGISMFSTMLPGLLIMLMTKYPILKYTLLPHVDLSNYRDGGHILEGMSLTFSIVVICVYVVVALAASFVTFRKRDVS
ncbi:ABC transporter permease [Paenibacillus sp. L3-i20]|uniref:ABC transporter permease n=1 Tax=Paenibacillus sp. L3-i20 TaxID=2905833 RepID=UPI001EE04D53|nr:DUF2705 family protein [Paenibacillus sp. L3-i20]GKU78236.1 hypothetical protein L3i20_v226330 [Paenibacillus sp. L3-i20]